jgi:hypothetical protein
MQAEFEKDMQTARSLLRFVWQSYDRGGETFGRSSRCAALEGAIDLLDFYFDRDVELNRQLDTEAYETLERTLMLINWRKTDKAMENIKNRD